ncbi:cryptochrome/photolyase family protein [Streptacidiphilus anmyonensis]|uniref:cryptochrome/photolyase family protein n=1 Tax=Streptacidiphilus anmyonensis TaxID=405782 RepID=UPI00128B1F97
MVACRAPGGAAAPTTPPIARCSTRRLDADQGPLLDQGQPVGGRGNLDADNRERPPRDAPRLPVEPPWWPQEDDVDEEVRADLSAFGDVPPVRWRGPVRRDQGRMRGERESSQTAGQVLETVMNQ